MAKAAAVELPQASRWHSRVVRWAENIRRDLRADSVASPRGMESYWMLYIPKKAGATDTTPPALPVISVRIARRNLHGCVDPRSRDAQQSACLSSHGQTVFGAARYQRS